jgi:hypothetical protein
MSASRRTFHGAVLLGAVGLLLMAPMQNAAGALVPRYYEAYAQWQYHFHHEGRVTSYDTMSIGALATDSNSPAQAVGWVTPGHCTMRTRADGQVHGICRGTTTGRQLRPGEFDFDTLMRFANLRFTLRGNTHTASWRGASIVETPRVCCYPPILDTYPDCSASPVALDAPAQAKGTVMRQAFSFNTRQYSDLYQGPIMGGACLAHALQVESQSFGKSPRTIPWSQKFTCGSVPTESVPSCSP